MAKKKTAKRKTKKVVKKSANLPAGSSAEGTKAGKAGKAVKKSPKKAAAKKIPHFTSINPYLTFNGNCEEAFNYYREVFGGKFGYIGRFKDMPPQDGQKVPAEQANLVMHVSLPISKETTLMGSDSSPEFGGTTIIGNDITISVNAKSKPEADRIFNGLSQQGRINMPMSNTFWGSYFGMCTDKFGINWMMSWSKAGMM